METTEPIASGAASPPGQHGEGDDLVRERSISVVGRSSVLSHIVGSQFIYAEPVQFSDIGCGGGRNISKCQLRAWMSVVIKALKLPTSDFVNISVLNYVCINFH
jgi:hypothetical protein